MNSNNSFFIESFPGYAVYLESRLSIYSYKAVITVCLLVQLYNSETSHRFASNFNG